MKCVFVVLVCLLVAAQALPLNFEENEGLNLIELEERKSAPKASAANVVAKKAPAKAKPVAKPVAKKAPKAAPKPAPKPAAKTHHGRH